MTHSTFYREYINSDAWREKRKPVLARAKGHCENPACRANCSFLEVHHRHYRTLGQECLP